MGNTNPGNPHPTFTPITASMTPDAYPGQAFITKQSPFYPALFIIWECHSEPKTSLRAAHIISYFCP